MVEKMDTRILRKIMTIDNIERMEKSIADAVADLDVQKGIEADHKSYQRAEKALNRKMTLFMREVRTMANGKGKRHSSRQNTTRDSVRAVHFH